MAAMRADNEAVQTGASTAVATPADARFEAFAQALDTCVETEERAADQRAEGAEDPDTDQRRARDIAEVHRALTAWATKGTGSATVSGEQPRGTLSAFMYKKQDEAYMGIGAEVHPKDRGFLPDNEDLVAGFIHAFGFAIPGEEDGAEELSSVQRMRLEDALEAYFEAMKANCPEDDDEDGEESSDDEGGFNWAPPEIPGLIDLEEFRQRMMGPRTVREILGIEAGDTGDNNETSDTIETGEAGEIGGKASDSA